MRQDHVATLATLVALLISLPSAAGFGLAPAHAPPLRLRAPAVRACAPASEEVDVVWSGLKVAVLESHYEIGGCAHEFNVNMDGKPVPSELLAKKPQPVFKFEAGPSLYSGLSADASPNPLKHIFQMVGEEPEWINYDTWGAHLPEVPEGYELSIGAENFMEILRRYGGPTAREDWDRLAEQLMPLTKGVTALPSTAVRGDAGVLLTLGARYPRAFLDVILNAQKITAPFDLEAYGVRDPFLKNYLDLIAFLLQGLPSNGTLTAVMAFMVDEFYKPDAVMDFPKGGSGAMAAALARGVTKHAGCSVRTSTPVEEVVADNTFRMVPEGAHAGFDEERDALLAPAAPVYSDDDGPADGEGLPLCKSFMHLYLGVRADAMPPDLPPQWTVVNSWDVPIDAPGNVIVSVPSILDPSLAPEGHHVIHAYTAGNEPYHIWERFEGVDTNKDAAYLALKEERAAPMWEAIRRRVPRVEEGVVVRQIGTPLTHARFLRRHRGNYGLALAAGGGFEFPKVTTPLPGLFRCGDSTTAGIGLFRCGDSTTAGIGVPAVASSGAQCANALLSVWEQLKMNDKIKMPSSAGEPLLQRR
ncbi:hypothetical protein EMIHUDRAFT_447628 [Emiliania huxleyi CCMP1516]|uniref:Amine oxidase domain-containing protein n=2 Tax=Emiliania huxleyi TaxID=2903 RepID=A0A0D3JGQ8_EMIH1|nr:hypothetical protein EMIHUDRAFT_447628 [Emiliania huxleyi CCMP1516]EOD22693.1 hypothetical protein EMIHUDRAFT_447628 [Emiliania huxleyi CCMP1516]|eukprot:XP_005775122.1 hypothetical protein EMIHUDRAFT_447628 [Emiliania huxleyi CCMP1516]